MSREQRNADRERDRRGSFLVAVYDQDRAYGGAEEGGWWYDTGTLVRVVAVRRTERAATEVAARINRTLAYRRDAGHGPGYPIDSVCYEGGHLAAEVCEDTAPLFYPEARPHYE